MSMKVFGDCVNLNIKMNMKNHDTNQYNSI
jgi:hypothetical protein